MREWEDRQVKRIPLPPTAEEQAAFDRWKSEYARLEELGHANSWLDGSGYEGYFPGNPRPSGYEEREETNEEYESRLASSIARVTWELRRSLLRTFEAQHACWDRLAKPHRKPELPDDLDLTARGGTVIFPAKKRGAFGE